MLEGILFVYGFGMTLSFTVLLLLGFSLREHWSKNDSVLLHFAACFAMAVVWPYTIYEMVGLTHEQKPKL